MELHIKRFSYMNIYKRQQKINLICWGIIFSILAAIVALIPYDYIILSLIGEIIALIMMLMVIFKARKEKKLLKNISYDLVIVDEFNKFFYKNIIFEMNDLDRFLVVNEGIHLYFKDYYLFVENNEEIINYLKKFTKEGFDAKVNLRNYAVSVMICVGFFLLMKNIFDILIGMIYCQITNAVLFDTIGLMINIIQIAVLILIPCICIFIARKFKVKIHLPTYICMLIMYIILPLLIPTNVTSLNDDIVYVNHNNQSIDVYKNVKKFFGESVISLEGINESSKIDLYEDILYLINDNKLITYNLNNEKDNINDVIKKYNNHYFTASIDDNHYVLVIKDNEFYFKNGESNELDKIEMKVIGKNIISFQYNKKYFFINFNQTNDYWNSSYVEIYILNTKQSHSMTSYQGEYEEKTEEVEERKELTYEEMQNQLEEEKKQLYQQRYNEYQEVIKQNDISNYHSTKNVVKVYCQENDIYKVIKEVDKEITRINNEEDVILDVQIGCMQVYSQIDNEYGIYISTAVDKNGERGYGYDEVILMKKYENNYIATRVGETYMPSTGLTNNSTYYTNTTTDYLYRVKGNKVVNNAW